MSESEAVHIQTPFNPLEEYIVSLRLGPDEARNKSWGKAPTALPVYLRPKTQRAKKPSRNITTSTAKTTSL